MMFDLDYLETPDDLAPTGLVSTGVGSQLPASESNSRGTGNGLINSSENAELRDAGEVSSTRGSDDDFLGDFCPHILHEPHKPVPIAMVNRRPTGSELFRSTADVLHTN
jgi:hypothetical protein